MLWMRLGAKKNTKKEDKEWCNAILFLVREHFFLDSICGNIGIRNIKEKESINWY